MNNKVEGIVLRQTEYRDSDMILSVFTKDNGKISFLARGIKKAQSKNASACSLFTQSVFHYDENNKKELQIVKTVERKKMFYHIYDDLLKQSCAQFMCECVEKICDEANEEMYDLLYKCLTYLNDDQDALLVVSLFLVHCSDYSGVSANVDACVLCHDTSRIASFSVMDGGFVCVNCFDSLKHTHHSETMLRSIRLLHKAGVDDYFTLSKYTKGNIEEFKLILSLFEEYSGIHLKSTAFLFRVLEM